MLPQLNVYVKSVLEKKSPDPKTKSFGVVKACCDDKLIEAKLSFYRSVGQQIQPFLKLYQTDRPMMPLLSSDLFDLLKSLMRRVIKADVLKIASNAVKLCEIKVSDESNQLNYRNVDIGFSADKMLKKLVKDKKCSERQDMEFRQSAKAFIITILSRLLIKNPLTFRLVRNMSFLDPRLMFNSGDDCKKKFKVVLNVLVEANRVDESDCDDILGQFSRYIEEIQTKHVTAFSSFKPAESRIDTLMYQTLTNRAEYCKLWSVISQLLLLSHGQATVKKGFSVNRQIEVENRLENSYVAQRTVCDHIHDVGGLMNVSLSKELLRAAAGARMQYQVYLEENKKKQTTELQSRKRNLLEQELKDLIAKKARIETDMQHLAKSADSFAFKAEENCDLTLIAKSNAMRKSANVKSAELPKLQQLISDKQLELQSC